MAGHAMPKEVEARIRQLPGNNLCCDCNNMDSWTEKQIAAMEKSGGNASLVDFFKSKGIEKSMNIATKYNTKQAAYYRERLSRRMEGRTEPPPDPGCYDPTTGGSEAQGAEPLPGETTDQYNERQARLREAARERLRQKFGGGGMGGVGSQANVATGGFGSGGGGGYNEGIGGLFGSAVGLVGGVAGGAANLLREKVVENDNLHSGLRGTLGGALDLTQNVVESVRDTIERGDVVGAVGRNVTMQDGSLVSSAVDWTRSSVTTIVDKGGSSLGGAGFPSGFGDFFADEEDRSGSGGAQQAPKAPRCDKGHPLRTQPRSDVKCSLCKFMGTRYACSAGCDYAICTKCFEKPPTGKDDGFDFDDDDWGQPKEAPKDPTKEDMDKLAKEMGMKLTVPDQHQQKARSCSPSVGTHGAGTTGMSPPPAPALKKAASTSPSPVPSSSPSPPPQEKKKKPLGDDDDFFAEFGM